MSVFIVASHRQLRRLNTPCFTSWIWKLYSFFKIVWTICIISELTPGKLSTVCAPVPDRPISTDSGGGPCLPQAVYRTCCTRRVWCSPVTPCWSAAAAGPTSRWATAAHCTTRCTGRSSACPGTTPCCPRTTTAVRIRRCWCSGRYRPSSFRGRGFGEMPPTVTGVGNNLMGHGFIYSNVSISFN